CAMCHARNTIATSTQATVAVTCRSRSDGLIVVSSRRMSRWNLWKKFSAEGFGFDHGSGSGRVNLGAPGAAGKSQDARSVRATRPVPRAPVDRALAGSGTRGQGPGVAET